MQTITLLSTLLVVLALSAASVDAKTAQEKKQVRLEVCERKTRVLNKKLKNLKENIQNALSVADAAMPAAERKARSQVQLTTETEAVTNKANGEACSEAAECTTGICMASNPDGGVGKLAGKAGPSVCGIALDTPCYVNKQEGNEFAGDDTCASGNCECHNKEDLSVADDWKSCDADDEHLCGSQNDV